MKGKKKSALLRIQQNGVAYYEKLHGLRNWVIYLYGVFKSGAYIVRWNFICSRNKLVRM